MFSFLSLTAAALIATSTVTGLVVPRKEAPATYATGYLEDYNVYHTRYIALGCQNQHGKEFFDQCCHPLLATETLQANRPPQCTPSPAASSSAALAEPTSTVPTPADGDDDDDCDDDSSSIPAASSSAPSPPKSSPASPPKSSPAPPPKSTAAPPKSSPVGDAKNNDTPKSSSSSAPKPKPSDTSVSGLITGGVATFFYQGGVAGACGTVHKDSDLVAAIDQDRYGDSGEKSNLCGKQVKITNKDNGKSVTVTVVDDCPTCKNKNSIDLSTGAFDKIADENTGEVDIEWSFA